MYKIEFLCKKCNLLWQLKDKFVVCPLCKTPLELSFKTIGYTPDEQKGV